MKRAIIYCLILGSLWFAPVKEAEIAKLEPVQAVWVYRDNGEVVMETDTEDVGSGATVEEALSDMKQNSVGIIYLDTAEFLLIAEGMQQQIPAMAQYLKESVKVCAWDGQGSVTDAAKYMDAHKIGSKLGNWSPAVKLPNLTL